MKPTFNGKPYRGLIFDLDGVIIDTEPLHEEAKRIAYSDFGLLVPEILYREFRGRSDEDMAEFVTRTYGPPGLSHQDVLKHKHEIFEGFHDRIDTVAGVLEFIRIARSGFEKMAVATSATLKNQLYAFRRFGLGPYFDAVVTAADITRTKPHPDPYLTAAARLGLSPDACLVIEDSKNGILSAKAAGCAVAAITTSSSRIQLADAKADFTVDTFSELAMRLELKA